MATTANLYVHQGTDYFVSLSLSDENGDAFDIDGYSFFCDVKKLYSSTKKFSVELSPIINEETNDLEFYINPEDTVNLETGKYVYDVLMVAGGGSVGKILEGLMFILPTTTSVGG